MHTVGRRIAVILAVLILFALIGAAGATQYAQGCLYRDVNGNKAWDTNEPCESGWTLHAVVKDSTGTVVKQEDFVTNQLGASQGSTPASNKYAYALPTYISGTWTLIVTETAPPGFTVDVPSGASSTKTYSSTANVTGLAFGNLPMVYTADGCKWVDLDKSGDQGASETCQAGWTLHAKVTDGTNTIKEEDFTTNTAGSSGHFSYTLPAIPAGVTYYVTISEARPAGYVIIYPAGADKSYTKSYIQATSTAVGGFSFGNQPVSYTAEGCYWVDANGDGQQATDGTESCLAGQTLHALVSDGTNTIKEQDFTTNTAGSSGHFSYTLPPIPDGVTYYVTISEVPPDGYVVIDPVGAGKPLTYSYTKSYISTTTVAVGGFSFGNQQGVASAEGCFWMDANKDGIKQDTELCEAGRTLHATVTDDVGGVRGDQDFQTNTLGTDGKFSYSLPVPPTGKTWTVTISELVSPTGYHNVIPGGDVPSYSMKYSALDPAISGFSFGHTDPPVPVPEFPTVAVSILTISGMVIAVQFIKKRN
jgi:hypothetical protein